MHIQDKTQGQHLHHSLSEVRCNFHHVHSVRARYSVARQSGAPTGPTLATPTSPKSNRFLSGLLQLLRLRALHHNVEDVKAVWRRQT